MKKSVLVRFWGQMIVPGSESPEVLAHNMMKHLILNSVLIFFVVFCLNLGGKVNTTRKGRSETICQQN